MGTGRMNDGLFLVLRVMGLARSVLDIDTSISYAGITAGNCGTPKPAGLLPIRTADLSSYRGHVAALLQLGDNVWPFNFADLAPNQVL